jgi:hypothetical protein
MARVHSLKEILMAISFLLKISDTDLTGHVVQNTYDVNEQPVFKTYKDANEETHKRWLRDKISGSFQMVFSDIDEYLSFKALLDENTSQSNHTVSCTVYDNKSGAQKTINAFWDFSVTIKQTAGLKEYVEPFEVQLEEQ